MRDFLDLWVYRKPLKNLVQSREFSSRWVALFPSERFSCLLVLSNPLVCLCVEDAGCSLNLADIEKPKYNNILLPDIWESLM